MVDDASVTPQPPERHGPSPWNLPNVITVTRIFFAPVCLILILVDGGSGGSLRWWAAGVFVVAMATDGIDGHLARSRGLVTDFGKIADPIADKGMVAAALIALSIVHDLPWWVTIVILLREIGITVYRMIVLAKRVVPASRAGKLKTVVQVVAITAALIPLSYVAGPLGAAWMWLDIVTMTLAVLLTIYSGVMYLLDAERLHQQEEQQR